MSKLGAEDFAEFFRTLHDGQEPFPWQERLAKEVCAGTWPKVIDLPTASGKTACLDVALFSLAVTRTAPRRMFFVVDRRIIVNEAFDRMRKVAGKLRDAKSGVLALVADVLREVGGTTSGDPLDVFQLRGGIYRDQSWIRSPLKPMVITSTVDQVGSRLLFRGYGVSDSSAPIHASLIANDSIIFLDEAHCSRAFSQTLASVEMYRGDKWAKEPLKKPFCFVEMTATPTRETVEPFELEAPDKLNGVLALRLFAPKPTLLTLVKGRANDRQTLASSLAKQAVVLASETQARRIAVIVNRVATARAVFDILRKEIPNENLHLLMGRMRPFDRDTLVESKLGALKAGAVRDPSLPPTYVVSTQCLEVGADFDFDVLVSECASIDALLQRFGRLDRLGQCRGTARGSIITLSGIAESQDDPIYGPCLSKTWGWLNALAGDAKQVDMGIETFGGAAQTVSEALNRQPADGLRRIGPSAPSLLPSHLDALVQTSPKPNADPNVALFLHGRQEGPAEIQVVWRKDLDEKDADGEKWKKIVALCPPVSAEAMPVRLDQFRRWFTGQSISLAADSDLEGAGEMSDDESTAAPQVKALLWRGDKSKMVEAANEIRPNETLVLSLSQGGWEAFGHVPEPVEDIAEQAIRIARARAILRIHPRLWSSPDQIKPLLEKDEFDWDIWKTIAEVNQEFLLSRGFNSSDPKAFKQPAPYPVSRNEKPEGWVLELKKRVPGILAELPFGEDDGEDEKSYTSEISLEDHTDDVVATTKNFANRLLPQYAKPLTEAAIFHDTGKIDSRFQTFLHGGNKMAALFYPTPLAKSKPISMGLYKAARDKSGLPGGFRHELISLLIAKKISQVGSSDIDLALHLIATHHGYCRPFAPVVIDEKPDTLAWRGIEISSSEQIANPAHHLASGIPRRFWRFTRQFGWWGSAYLESCLRLADWEASESEQERREDKQ